MSDTPKAPASEASTADAEKLLMQARMALKTGVSAYENENYVFAETLLVKALDLFEQVNKVEDKEYFQCLHQIADTYFQLGRYYEAKSYYERLSVARLKNPDSTDAQVVVALLKLASTYEKLDESAEALTAFDLIMELAEKTIPNGHALFGVIFDSYEDLINRRISDVDERERRETIIMQKREQFGFAKDSSEARWAHAVTPATEPVETAETVEESDNVLTQPADKLRNKLRAWTQAEIPRPQAALEEAVQRANMERLAELQEREEVGEKPREDIAERHLQAHLHPDMFRRKPHTDRDDAEVEIVQKELGAPTVEEAQAERTVTGAVEAGGAADMGLRKATGERGALRGKRPNTDRKRFNPIPAITVIACLAAVGGAMFVAHEYVKNAGVNNVKVVAVGQLDYSGKSWASSDGRKVFRCLTPVTCDYTVGGAAANGTYAIKGQAQVEKSILSDFFNGKPTPLTFDEVPAGLKSNDGVVLYSDSSKDKAILLKAEEIANFATYYFASHGHLYPSKPEDFKHGNAKIGWENPISGQKDVPILKCVTHSKEEFESAFALAVKNLRDGKAVFTEDGATTGPPGLIECLALIPSVAAPAAQKGDPPTLPPQESTEAVDEAGCAFLIRAYDSEGKLICTGEPGKVFVVTRKNGVSIDPVKIVHEEASLSPPVANKVEVVINPMPAAAAEQKGASK